MTEYPARGLVYDRDGVLNIFDCKPKNKRLQGYMHRQEIIRRLPIVIEGNLSPLRRGEVRVTPKSIVRVFEKNPDLLMKAQGIHEIRIKDLRNKQVGDFHPEGIQHPAAYYPYGKKVNNKFVPILEFSHVDKYEDAHLEKSIKHELEHHYQNIHPNFEKKQEKKWGKEDKERAPRSIYRWSEVDARIAEEKPTAREKAIAQGSKPQVLQSWDKDTDKDGVVDAADCEPNNCKEQGWQHKNSKYVYERNMRSWRASNEERREAYKKLREAGVPAEVAQRVRQWRPNKVKEVLREGEKFIDTKIVRKRLQEEGYKTSEMQRERDRKRYHTEEFRATRRRYHQREDVKERRKEYLKEKRNLKLEGEE
jgi:hypothetical protein